MKSKTLECNSNRLVIVITYQDEQLFSSILAISGVAILMLTYLGVTAKILASSMKTNEDVSIFCYIAGLIVLIYGLPRLYSSFLISKFSFDKIANQLEVENKYFTNTNKQVFRLTEVTGVEEVSKPKTTPELFLWIKKGNQSRGEKIPFAKASMTNLHMLWREVSEFLKDQPNLILTREWLIEQNKDKIKIYRSRDMFRNPDNRAYTVDREIGFLIYELDGKEVERYKIKDIKNVETEVNPDKSDEEGSDRIVLTMIDGSTMPISIYWYYTGDHPVIVRTLKYALGLEKYLHLSPSF